MPWRLGWQPTKRARSPDDRKARLAVEETPAPDEAEDDVLALRRGDRPEVPGVEVNVAIVAHEKPSAGLEGHLRGGFRVLRGAQRRVRSLSVFLRRASEHDVLVGGGVADGDGRLLA